MLPHQQPQTKKHKDHFIYFMLYCTAMTLHGINLIGLGSYIPYLTATTGIIQTEYSYFFTVKSLGMLLGAFFIKVLQRSKFSNHNLLIIGALIVGLFTVLFSFTLDSFWLGVWLFMASIGYSVYQVIVNVCILLISPPDQTQYWMLIGHGAFGVGGIISPIFVYLFELHTFLVFGGLILLLIPFLLKMKTPQQHGFVSEDKQSPKMKAKVISRTLQYCLGFMIFIYVGIECAYGGWIPSYAVLAKVTNHQGATKFPSIYWIFLTLFRFCLAYAPGSSKQKLKILIEGDIIVGILALIIIYTGHTQAACYISAILYGLSMSSIFPLIFTFPIEEGLIIEDSQATNIAIAGVVSQGAVTMIIGKLMQWVHIDMLFYSISFFAVILWLFRHYCLNLIAEQKQRQNQNGMHTQLLPVKQLKQ